MPVETVAEQARIPIALRGSTKAALDRDWSDPEQRNAALGELVAQLSSLHTWLERTQPSEADAIVPANQLEVQVPATQLDPCSRLPHAHNRTL